MTVATIATIVRTARMSGTFPHPPRFDRLNI
jgi:hypothetical protein